MVSSKTVETGMRMKEVECESVKVEGFGSRMGEFKSSVEVAVIDVIIDIVSSFTCLGS